MNVYNTVRKDYGYVVKKVLEANLILQQILRGFCISLWPKINVCKYIFQTVLCRGRGNIVFGLQIINV